MNPTTIRFIPDLGIHRPFSLRLTRSAIFSLTRYVCNSTAWRACWRCRLWKIEAGKTGFVKGTRPSAKYFISAYILSLLLIDVVRATASDVERMKQDWYSISVFRWHFYATVTDDKSSPIEINRANERRRIFRGRNRARELIIGNECGKSDRVIGIDFIEGTRISTRRIEQGTWPMKRGLIGS